MSSALDALVEYMEHRHGPICPVCVSEDLGYPFDHIMVVSVACGLRKVEGFCAECRRPCSIVFLPTHDPSTGGRSRPRAEAAAIRAARA